MIVQFVDVMPLEDFPPGSCTSVELPDQTIALFNLEGQIHALDNTCPHAGGPLGEGNIEGEFVLCPWHSWKFHIPTGVCQRNPNASWNVPRYEVRIANGVIQVGRPVPQAPTDHEISDP